jgi:hypothetical protein
MGRGGADDEEAEVEVEETAAAPEHVPGEPMDIMTALQLVLKKSLAHHGLARGLREACKVRRGRADGERWRALPLATCFRRWNDCSGCDACAACEWSSALLRGRHVLA